VVDGRTKEVVAGLGDMLQAGSDFMSAMSRGDLFGMAVAQIHYITGAIHAIKNAFGIGESAEAKQLHQQQDASERALVTALEALRQTLIDVSSEQMRRDQAKIGQAAAVLAKDPHTNDDDSPVRRREALRNLAVQLGLAGRDDDKMVAIDKLTEWAKQLDARYGTNLAQMIADSDPEGLLKAFRAMPAAMQDAASRAGQFGDDAAGIIARVTWELQAMGKTSVVDRLREINKQFHSSGKSLGDFASSLDELSTLDLSTEAGRTRRDEIVEQMVRLLDAGGANTGELSPSQLRQLIQDWGGATADDGSGGAVGGGAAARLSVSETEVQANELLAQAQTQTLYQSFLPRIYEALRLMGHVELDGVDPLVAYQQALLAAYPVTALPAYQPPAVPSGDGGPTTFIFDLSNLHVPVVVAAAGSSADSPEVQAAVATATDTFGKSFAQDLQARWQAAGRSGPVRVEVRTS
jgi:hypothetical protein